MRRTTRIAFGTALVLAACTAVTAQPPAGGAPAPAAAGTDLYPLKAGNKWVYKVADTTTIEMKVDKMDGGEALIKTFVGGKEVASESIKVSADKVERTKINGTAITPPVKILELPATKDKSWKVDSKIAVGGTDHAIKGEFKVTDVKEKVKVRDKEYEAVVVNGADFEIAGTKAAIKYWFAPGKGIVKLSYSIAGNEAVLEMAEGPDAK